MVRAFFLGLSCNGSIRKTLELDLRFPQEYNCRSPYPSKSPMRFAMNCTTCGRANQPDAIYCYACGTKLAIAEEPTSLPRVAVVPSAGFVGRQRELLELQSILEEVLSGQGRLALLAGEPGIGKTRTAQELAAYAEARGYQIYWGRCYEEAGTPPYWPWVQIVRDHLQQHNPADLAEVMGLCAGDIAEIVPEVRSKLPDALPPPPLEPEQSRYRLFDSITSFLKNAARSQPLLLALDDLHWADHASLLLLQFVARRMGDSPFLIVGTYRDVEVSRRHPLSETLAQLVREPVFRRQPLKGFNREDTRLFIGARSAVHPSQNLVEAIHSQTEGNPFFLTEVMRLLADRGETASEWAGDTLAPRIPEGVRDAIGQRLNRLSEGCNQVLTIASVIGREFDLQLVRALMEDVDERKLLALVDEALEAHLLEELPGVADRYQFSHALVRGTLLSEMSTSRRVRLHLRVGEALETIYGTEAEDHAAELARHFAEAEAISGPEKLVRYSLLAGEQALAAYAWEEAREHFQRGLEAKGVSLKGGDLVRDAAEAALLFGEARAQSAILPEDEFMETFALMKRAFGYYAEAGNIPMAVAIAEFPISPTGRFPGNTELMVRALALVPNDSYEAGRLLSRYGGVLGLAQSDYPGAQQALRRALSIAREKGNVGLEVQTLTYSADVSGQHLHWQESVNLGLQSIGLAGGHESIHSTVLSRWWTSTSLLQMGDLERARPHAVALRDLAKKQSTPRFYSMLGSVPIVTLSCLEGNWKAGRKYCNPIPSKTLSYRQLLCARILLEYETGEIDQGRIFLEQLIEETRAGLYSLGLGKVPMTLIAVGRITGVVDHLDLGEATAGALLSEPSNTPIIAMHARTGLALLAIHQGNKSAAAEHYAYFREHRGTMLWTVSSVDRLIGLLSQMMGKLDQASVHFEDALAFCARAGYRPELAWTCHDYAKTLFQRNNHADRKKGMALLEEGQTIAGDLGMAPLMSRIIALKEQAAPHATSAAAYPDGLSQREVEVLRLVATGMRDREIAEALYISVATVSTHVRNILNKINSANRTEAANYAAKHGLA